MTALRELTHEILHDGSDLEISPEDWDRVRQHLPAAGGPGREELLALLEMRSQASKACPAFDDYFFPAFKSYLLADGKITPMEHYQLVRMLYGGRTIDDAERQFLRELRSELREVTPEFEAMYKQAMKD